MIDLQLILISFFILAAIVLFLAIKLHNLQQDFNFLEKYVNDLGIHVTEQTERFNKLLKFLIDSTKEDKLDKNNDI